MYFWVIVHEGDSGRWFLVNQRFSSQSRADKYGERKYDGRYEVMPTDSGDKVEAAREIRSLLSQRPGSSGWGKNFKHGKPVADPIS